jgi:hypothetical protein
MMRAVCQISGPYNLAGVVDPGCAAVIAPKSSDVRDYFVLPDICVIRYVACKKGNTDDLTSIIQGAYPTEGSTQRSEVNHPAPVPEKWMHQGKTKSRTWG